MHDELSELSLYPWHTHQITLDGTLSFDSHVDNVQGGTKKVGPPTGLMLTQEGPTFFAPPCM